MLAGQGTRIQEGTPRRPPLAGEQRANGLLLRGVVIATYVSDSGDHPFAADDKCPPVAVYCDVIIMPSMARQRWFALKKVLVAQPQAGMHHGPIWRPRAATVDLSKALDSSGATTNPAYIDGDHVLIGFLNDSLAQPVILSSLPHPTMDTGNEELELGRRMKLTLTDGDPALWKHHGIYWGALDIGNFVVDSTWANDGELTGEGKEADPPTDGKGCQNFRLPMDASFNIQFFDMADPTSPEEVFHVEYTKEGQVFEIADAAGQLYVKIENGDSMKLTGKGAAAKLVIGGGAVKAAIADHMAELWGSLKQAMDQADNHVHPTGMGPSGPPNPKVAMPAWNTSINSNQLTFPDNAS